MITPGQYGGLFEVIPIFAAALLLGIASGVAAVHFLTARPRWRSTQSLMGVIALLAPLMSLIAARPSSGPWTAGLFVLGGVLMAGVDLAATCLVDPRRAVPRFSRRTRRRFLTWGAPGFVAAFCLALACLRVGFDIPLNPELQPSFAAELAATLLAVVGLDLAFRAAFIGLARRWKTTDSTVAQ